MKMKLKSMKNDYRRFSLFYMGVRNSSLKVERATMFKKHVFLGIGRQLMNI